MQYDLYYVKHMSLMFDLLIALETIKTVVLRRGARVTRDRQCDDRRRRGLLPGLGVRSRRVADRRGPSARAAWSRTRIGCSSSSIGTRSARTFFVLGWVAERFPSLVREIAALGHEVASHGFHHQLVYTLTPDQFRDDVRRAKAVIEDAARLRGARLSGAELLDRRIEPVGARRADRRRLRLRRQHLPDSSRSLRHSGRAAARARDRARCRHDRGGAGVDGARRPVEPADRRRRLFPAVAVRVDEMGHRAREHRRAAIRSCSTSIPGKIDPDQPRCRCRGSRGGATTATSTTTLHSPRATGRRFSLSIRSTAANVAASGRRAASPAAGEVGPCANDALRVIDRRASAIAASGSVRRRPRRCRRLPRVGLAARVRRTPSGTSASI